MARILVIANPFPVGREAVVGSFVREQVIALSGEHDVCVLVPVAQGPWRVLRGQLDPPLARSSDGRVTIVRSRRVIPPIIPIEASRYRAYALAGIAGMEAVEAAWGRPDVIHAHSTLPAGWVASVLSRRLGVPFVVTEHSARWTTHYGARRTVRPYALAALADACLVTTPSTSAARSLQAACGGCQPEVVPNLVDTAFFSPAARVRGRSPVRLLSVGLMTQVKRFDTVLDAALLLRRLMPGGFTWSIGGDGPLRRALEARALRAGLSDDVQFVGMLSRMQVREAMRACDVFALASDHESFGLVVAEALACGKPVVVTRSGGPEDFVSEEVGLVVPRGDASALAEGIACVSRRLDKYEPAELHAVVDERFGRDAFLGRWRAVYRRVGCEPAPGVRPVWGA